MKIESSILKRLGPIPFWRGEKKCLDELQRIYTRAIDAANRKSENPDEPGAFAGGGKRS